MAASCGQFAAHLRCFLAKYLSFLKGNDTVVEIALHRAATVVGVQAIDEVLGQTVSNFLIVTRVM